MYDEICGFIRENKSYCLAFIVIVIACIAGAWLVYDAQRNEPIHENTNNAMADVERRIQNIEQRINSLQSRVDKAEKTVERTIVTIRDGRENAATVADGIAGAEKRLDAIIQRQGRIENIIANIEAANRQGTAHP